MDQSDNQPFEISLPFECGPTFDVMGHDVARLYEAGKRIFANAEKKVDDLDDGRTANFRVARETLWSGSACDSAICVEYFGGILASSRTPGGEDDSSIEFVETVKSLSSSQLKLHYLIYRELNAELYRTPNSLDCTEPPGVTVFIPEEDLIPHARRLYTDLVVLQRCNLISEYSIYPIERAAGTYKLVKIGANAYGALLFCAALNLLDDWKNFGKLPPDTGSDIGERIRARVHEQKAYDDLAGEFEYQSASLVFTVHYDSLERLEAFLKDVDGIVVKEFAPRPFIQGYAYTADVRRTVDVSLSADRPRAYAFWANFVTQILPENLVDKYSLASVDEPSIDSD